MIHPLEREFIVFFFIRILANLIFDTKLDARDRLLLFHSIFQSMIYFCCCILIGKFMEHFFSSLMEWFLSVAPRQTCTTCVNHKKWKSCKYLKLSSTKTMDRAKVERNLQMNLGIDGCIQINYVTFIIANNGNQSIRFLVNASFSTYVLRINSFKTILNDEITCAYLRQFHFDFIANSTAETFILVMRFWNRSNSNSNSRRTTFVKCAFWSMVLVSMAFSHRSQQFDVWCRIIIYEMNKYGLVFLSLDSTSKSKTHSKLNCKHNHNRK